MPTHIITLPCTARELEDALHRVCDHSGLWDAEVRLVLRKPQHTWELDIYDETKGETK